jgi:hypothetical protein
MIVAGTAGELVYFNDLTANSVAFSTTSEKVGGTFLAISDGTSWIIVPIVMESQTVTVVT